MNCCVLRPPQSLLSHLLGRAMIGVSLLATGCATWQSEPTASSQKLAPKLLETPPGHISLQTMFLRLEGDEIASLQRTWAQLDEMSFDLGLRRELELNGIRCGVVLGAMPSELQRLLDRTETALHSDPLENADLNADVSSHPKTYICKSGVDKDLPAKPQRSGSVTVLHYDGQPKGGTYRDPAFMLKLRGVNKAGGGIRLSVRPFLEHGEYRSQVTGQSFAMRREMTREVKNWPNLEISRERQPGQVLVIGSTDPPRALGSHFFSADQVGGLRVATVLLIRVGSSGSDQAFIR